MLGRQEDEMARGRVFFPDLQAARGDLFKNVIKRKQVAGEDLKRTNGRKAGVRKDEDAP